MLTSNEYATILKYYKVSIPKTKKKRRKRVHRILAGKLCRCIKTVRKKMDERKAIGICTKSIFKRKGLMRQRFTCKRRPKLLPSKRTKHVLRKRVKGH